MPNGSSRVMNKVLCTNFLFNVYFGIWTLDFIECYLKFLKKKRRSVRQYYFDILRDP